VELGKILDPEMPYEYYQGENEKHQDSDALQGWVDEFVGLSPSSAMMVLSVFLPSIMMRRTTSTMRCSAHMLLIYTVVVHDLCNTA
jgi:hypothetical protein